MSSGGVQRRARTLDEQATKVGVAVFRNVAKACLAARGMLPRSETEPGGELPAAAEIARITYGRDYGKRAERSDAAYLHESLRRLTDLCLLIELVIVFGDTFVEHADVRQQVRYDSPREQWDRLRRG